MTTPQFDAKAFRNALGQFATGVTVVTTLDQQGNKVGMTANSFSSVSLDPMLVLWSIAKTSTSFDVFNETNHFAIHVLKASQKALSNQFASRCEDRFEGIPYSNGLANVPVLEEYSALFQCETETRYEGGDHIIIIGRVIDFDYRGDGEPLIFHAGRYADIPMPA